MGVPQNGWFIRENPNKLDDLGVPLFQETSTYQQICYLSCAYESYRISAKLGSMTVNDPQTHKPPGLFNSAFSVWPLS